MSDWSAWCWLCETKIACASSMKRHQHKSQSYFVHLGYQRRNSYLCTTCSTPNAVLYTQLPPGVEVFAFCYLHAHEIHCPSHRQAQLQVKHQACTHLFPEPTQTKSDRTDSSDRSDYFLAYPARRVDIHRDSAFAG